MKARVIGNDELCFGAEEVNNIFPASKRNKIKTGTILNDPDQITGKAAELKKLKGEAFVE